MREDNKLLWTVVVVKQFTEDNVWPCGPTDKASDYESGDCRFESCQGHNFWAPIILLAGDKNAPPGGLEPPTFRLTAERASRLRHGGGLSWQAKI